MNDPKPADEAETPPLDQMPDEDAAIPHDDGSLFDDGSGYSQ